MRTLKILKWKWRSFYKNIIVKRKFRSYWMFITDKEYRAQINNLYELTKNSVGTRMKFVPTSLLVHGHNVVYMEYATKLMMDDNVELPPVKVVKSNGKYVVVDGNHRLPAILLRAKYRKADWTYVEEII